MARTETGTTLEQLKRFFSVFGKSKPNETFICEIEPAIGSENEIVGISIVPVESSTRLVFYPVPPTKDELLRMCDEIREWMGSGATVDQIVDVYEYITKEAS